MLLSHTLLVLFAGLATAQNAVVDFINGQEDLSILADLLTIVPDLADALGSADNITIFAPVNSAFEAIPSDSAVGQIIEARDPNGTAALLSYHVLNINLHSGSLIRTLYPLYYPTLLDNSSIVDGTPVANVPGGQNLGVFLDGEDFTVVSGALQTTTVVERDLLAGDVLVHKIQDVLSIPQNLTTTAPLFATAFSAALNAIRPLTTGDGTPIPGTGGAGGLDTFPGFTIFIPNDAAFQAVASEFPLIDGTELALSIFYSRVLGEVIFSYDFSNTTYQEGEFDEGPTFSVVDGEVYVDSARVVVPNILLSNGVAHIIDTVLNRNIEQPFDRDQLRPVGGAPTPAFPGASATGGVPFATGGPATFVSIPPFATSAPAPVFTLPGDWSPTEPSGTQPTLEATFTGAAAVPTAIVGGGALVAGLAFAGALL